MPYLLYCNSAICGPIVVMSSMVNGYQGCTESALKLQSQSINFKIFLGGRSLACFAC